MRCLFIYNPVSGNSKKIIDNLDYITQVLLGKYKQVDVASSNARGHATTLAKKACGVYDVIVFAGGDGTFNEVVNGVSHQPVKPILGYLPSGTVCDMARNLKIPTDLKKALNIIIEGNEMRSDICKINDRYFVYVAGIGTYTDISFKPNQNLKRKIGKLAYFMEGIKKSFNTKTIGIKVEADGREYQGEAILLLVANSKCIGGFTINKNSNIRDGKVDIIIVKSSLLRTPINIWRFLLGRSDYLRKKSWIEFIETSKAKIIIDDDITWNLDGEESLTGSVEIEVLNDHLSFLVDRKKVKKV